MRDPHDLSLHDMAFFFWSLLAQERAEFAGGVALANTSVPYLLANAAWRVPPDALEAVIAWYEARGLPPAVVVPVGGTLEAALGSCGFRPELGFAFREAQAPPHDPASVAEQVGWTQLRYAGELLSAHYGAPGLALALTGSLSRAVQADAGIEAFLSYRDAPAGMMMALEGEATFAAMLLVDPDGSLEARLRFEAEQRGKRALVLEVLPEGSRIAPGFSRWSRPEDI